VIDEFVFEVTSLEIGTRGQFNMRATIPNWVRLVHIGEFLLRCHYARCCDNNRCDVDDNDQLFKFSIRKEKLQAPQVNRVRNRSRSVHEFVEQENFVHGLSEQNPGGEKTPEIMVVHAG
jgi:hypothetical protein